MEGMNRPGLFGSKRVRTNNYTSDNNIEHDGRMKRYFSFGEESPARVIPNQSNSPREPQEGKDHPGGLAAVKTQEKPKEFVPAITSGQRDVERKFFEIKAGNCPQTTTTTTQSPLYQVLTGESKNIMPQTSTTQNISPTQNILRSSEPIHSNQKSPTKSQIQTSAEKEQPNPPQQMSLSTNDFQSRLEHLEYELKLLAKLANRVPSEKVIETNSSVNPQLVDNNIANRGLEPALTGNAKEFQATLDLKLKEAKDDYERRLGEISKKYEEKLAELQNYDENESEDDPREDLETRLEDYKTAFSEMKKSLEFGYHSAVDHTNEALWIQKEFDSLIELTRPEWKSPAVRELVESLISRLKILLASLHKAETFLYQTREIGEELAEDADDEGEEQNDIAGQMENQAEQNEDDDDEDDEDEDDEDEEDDDDDEDEDDEDEYYSDGISAHVAEYYQ